MRRSLCTFFFTLLLISCNSYKFADYYSGKVLKKNGLTLHTLDLEKYALTYWDSETDKPPLILIHGFGTSGKFQWYKQANDFSKHYRLIIFNLFYFGSTPKTPVYSVKEQAEAINTMLDKLNVSSCYVCGASYGGLIAAEFVIAHPEKVKKLVLIDTPLKFHTEEDIDRVCKDYKISDKEELFVPGNPSMLKKITAITYLKPPKMPMSVVRSFYKHTYREEKDNLHQVYKSLLDEKREFTAKDYHFKIPVLLIWGEKDRIVPLHVGQELKEHIGQNAKLEIVSRSSHLPNLENEKAVNKLMTSFLNE
jgi:pimeloyl-ACP methyl ester carboxylesterase